jgi:hypothetical protein
VTINQIHNVYQVPETLQQSWFTRDYHGSHQNNSRGVIQRFLGYWDGNPANLIPLSPEDSGPLYVEMMGGAEKIMARGKELFDQGKYLHASEILNRLVQAEPDNQAAKDLLADVFEQIGYQKENPGLRNSFLAAAYELRNGIPTTDPQQQQPRCGPGDDHRPVPRLPRHPHGWPPDPGDAVRDQPGHAGQRREVRNRAEQRDPDQHRGLPGHESGPDPDHQPLRPGAGHDGREDPDGDDRGRYREGRGRSDDLAKIGAAMVDFDPRFPIMPGTQLRASEIPEVDPYAVEFGAPIPE